eukprot:5918058-Amphidinium_carterae.2
MRQSNGFASWRRRPQSSTILASTHNYAAELGQQHSTIYNSDVLHIRKTRTYINDVLLNPTGKHGKGQSNGCQQQPNYQQQGKGSTIVNHHHHNLPNTTKATAKAMENKWCSGYNKGRKKGQVPVQQINDNDYNYYNYEEDPHSWDYA